MIDAIGLQLEEQLDDLIKNSDREEDKERFKALKDIIDEAHLRANSIDAVRGLAYRNGHIRESEELDRARTMIFKLVDYIKQETGGIKWK